MADILNRVVTNKAAMDLHQVAITSNNPNNQWPTNSHRRRGRRRTVDAWVHGKEI